MEEEQVKIKKHLHPIEKERIIDLRNRGYTTIAISDIYKINERTVKRIIKKYKDSSTVDRKDGSGARIKYQQFDDLLISIIQNNRGLTLLEIKNMLKENHKIDYSKTNIYYRLKKIGYVKKRATLRIPLSEKQLNDREYWGIFYNGFDWNNVIWSDETKICNDSNNKQKIWIHNNENIIKCKYRYPISFNVWGMMTKNNKLIFKIFNKTENSDEYVKILENYLLPLYKKNKNYIFQQDNAPCHTSFKTISFFSRGSGIPLSREENTK
jgi:transposase